MAHIPNQAANCHSHSRQQIGTAIADIGCITLQCRNKFFPRTLQVIPDTTQLIHNCLYRMSLEEQLHTSKIHTTITEIGCRQFCHCKQRNAQAGRHKCKTSIATLFVFPYDHEWEHPEQQCVRPHNSFQCARRRSQQKISALTCTLHSNRSAYQHQCQRIVKSFRCTAEAGGNGLCHRKQCSAQHNALPPAQLSTMGEYSNA